jgi:hypothetical protein
MFQSGVILVLALMALPAWATPPVATVRSKAAAAEAAGHPVQAFRALASGGDGPLIQLERAGLLERNGEFASAASVYESLRAAPAAEDRAAADLGWRRLHPEVLIHSVPIGALIRVDRATEPVGRTPLRLRMLAGNHLVSLDLPGHDLSTSALRVEPARGQVLQVDLRDVPRHPGAVASLPRPPTIMDLKPWNARIMREELQGD